jgi:hypothetical protein
MQKIISKQPGNTGPENYGLMKCKNTLNKILLIIETSSDKINQLVLN